jgi:tetratricopeptide (TPR) repeat protein
MPEFEKALTGATLPLLARIPLGRARAVIFAATVVLGLAVAAVIASVWSPGGPVLDDDRVAVIPFEDLTGDTRFDDVGSLLAQEVANRLSRTGMVRIALPGQVATSWETLRDPMPGEENFDPRMALAEATQAGILVSGSYRLQGDSLRFFSEISLAREGWQGAVYDPVTLAAEPLDEAIDTVTERLTAAIVWDLDPSWGGFQPKPFRARAPTLAMYRAMDRAWDAWADNDLETSRREAEVVLSMDSTYLPAKTFLAVVLYHLGEYQVADSILTAVEPWLDEMDLGTLGQWEWIRATLDGDREEVYRAIKRSAERAPGPLAQLTVASEAVRSNRPREAWEVARELDPESPAIVKSGMWNRLGRNICDALHLLGEYRTELREVEKIRDSHPDSPRYIRFEIRARAALGQEERVSAVIDEALRKDPSAYDMFATALMEFRAHGNPEAARAVGEKGLAYLETRPAGAQETEDYRFSRFGLFYHLHRWEEAKEILDKLAQEHSSNTGYLALRGSLAAQMGQRQEAQTIAQQVEARKPPFDRGSNAYNRACIEAILEDREEAVNLLKEAYAEGWEGWLNLHNDPDLESLKGFGPFEEFMRPRG